MKLHLQIIMKIVLILIVNLVVICAQAAEHSISDIFRHLRCQTLLQNERLDFIDIDRLSHVQADLRGEDGVYKFPNGFYANGFIHGAYVYTEKDTRDGATHFNRTNRTGDELAFIFSIISIDEMKALRVLDFPSGKGSFVQDIYQKGIDIFGADIFLSRKLLKTGRFFPANLGWSPFRSNSFDVILSMHGPLSNVTHRLSVSNRYEEIKRILRPGGRLLIGRISIRSAKVLERELEQIKGLTYVAYHPEGATNYSGIVEILRATD